ncbi:MAG: hypothetical protein ACRBFS_24805 [Aureispira sp.]
MPDPIEKINKLEENIIAMEQELLNIEADYLNNDGEIDNEEREHLDDMFAVINDAVAELFQRKAALPPEITLAAFQAGTYEQDNYTPSTGLGLFDVSLDPVTGRLEVMTKLKFDFIDGTAAKFVGHAGENHIWTDKEKTTWKNSFIALLEGRWGGKFHFVHPDMPDQNFYVDVEIEEANSGWHFEANVTKIPKGEWKGSAVGYSHGTNQPDTLQATLDSGDLEWADKGVEEKQKGAVHEYGHMIGLDDEYTVDGAIAHAAMVRSALGTVLIEETSNDIMSSGNTIEKQHYITFLQALKDITKLKKWQFKK